ncbi:hypothetical protein, partial [Erwinia persicina]|uniref:hypothetical protein n=1 Tax=Erwinia persicina TaxID=55211 RepID=UPI0019589B5F
MAQAAKNSEGEDNPVTRLCGRSHFVRHDIAGLRLCKTAALPFCRPLARVLHALSDGATGKKKCLNFRSGILLKYGGERGVRTLDTLPYTHFP